VKRAAQSRQAISEGQLDHIVKLILDAVDG